MAERYGLLPSEVLQRASTLAVMVMDVSISYQQARQDQAQGRTPQVKPEVMLDILKKAKGET